MEIFEKFLKLKLRRYHILHSIQVKLGTYVHMDVLKVHAEKQFPGSNLTLTFGPLRGPKGSKRPIFEVFGTLKTEYLQEKKFVGDFR